MSKLVAAGIVYDTLCPTGQKHYDDVNRETAETSRTVFLLAEAEESRYHQIPYYRDQLAKVKTRAHNNSVTLQRHVAHCTDGCKRATDGTGFAARASDSYNRAPSHAKPDIPGAGELAAMLLQGQTVAGLAAVYERHPSTIQHRLTQAGFSSVTGLPVHRTADSKAPQTSLRELTLLEQAADQEWAEDALCAQTDPGSFFPEKGGSTREAKSVCARCTVSAECLDWAFDKEERFGVWGGLSERERRKIRAAIAAEIRAWAVDNDVACPNVGRVPADVRAAYDEAHPPEES